MKCKVILLYFIFAVSIGFSQEPNPAGFSYFSKYNKSLISGNKLQKHIFSIGTGISQFTSELSAPMSRIEGNSVNPAIPYARFGIGYHYFFLKEKGIRLSSKSRNEASGLSVYLNAYGTFVEADLYTQTLSTADSFRDSSGLILPQLELRVAYTNPVLSYRGKIFNFYVLHEFGLSFFNGTPNPILQPQERNLSVLANIVPLSLKLGTKPIFFKSTFNLALDNKLLQLQKIRGSYGIELQIYFYQAKVKKSKIKKKK